MIGSFSFKGVSSLSFGLVSKSGKRALLPAATPRRADTPGRSGTLDFDGMEYAMRQISMRLMYVGDDFYELRARAKRVAAWLASESWERLAFEDEKDVYYLAKVTGEIDLQAAQLGGVAEVSFDCQPFAYSVKEERASPGRFANPGTRRIDFRSPYGSKLEISAKVSGAAAISLNGAHLTYSGDAGTLIIDSVNMEATLGGRNVFGRLDGDVGKFFHINPGENVFEVAYATEAVCRYIPLWL